MSFAEKDLWEFVPVTLPNGYRIVATVDRPDGDTYDLGQNAEGRFRLFRRMRDPHFLYSHGKPEKLSETDMLGFGLTRQQCDIEDVSGDGQYSGLYTSNLIIP